MRPLITRYMKENATLNRNLVIKIFQSDMDTIKIQLVGYGLINCYQAKSAAGGVREFASLTDKGRRQMIEDKIIRTSEEPTLSP